MTIPFIIGRIAFVLIFILSGAQKLLDLGATATQIQTKVVLPAEIAGLAEQAATAVNMTVPQLLALIVGIVEVAGGLMIAANIGTRIAAVALILFTVAVTYFFHDFWNMTDPDRTANMVQAVKNVSIIGGLLVFFALGSWRPAAAGRYDDAAVVQRY
jgi:putative oxidoreductase